MRCAGFEYEAKGTMAKDGTLSSPTNMGVPDRLLAGCQVREVLQRIGDRWTMLVMTLLADGPRRYSDLRRSIEGISQRMLTLTLRNLESDGLVTRTVTPTNPPRVDYEVTEAGRGLCERIALLIDWVHDNRDYIHESRERYEAAKSLATPGSVPAHQ